VTDWALLGVIVQRAMPEHPFCQPRNRDPLSGVAVSVTVDGVVLVLIGVGFLAVGIAQLA
jgi:hypothetical protein